MLRPLLQTYPRVSLVEFVWSVEVPDGPFIARLNGDFCGVAVTNFTYHDDDVRVWRKRAQRILKR